MAPASMTGFARIEGHDPQQRWAWEVRSVNGRGLDARVRVPAGLERLEPEVRARLARRFKRGNVSVGLAVTRIAPTATYAVNRDLLDRLVALARELGREIEADPPRLDGLLAIRGVVEPVEAEPDEAARAALDAALLATFDQAVEALAAMRADEGRRLADVLLAQLDGMAALAARAGEAGASRPEAILARLTAQLQELLANVPALTPERLAQEVALIAAKGDIREELDRLSTHIVAARALVESDAAVGRKLDFLCQELNREANTLCSKSADAALTEIGIELKVLIEQFREQVQNIE